METDRQSCGQIYEWAYIFSFNNNASCAERARLKANVNVKIRKKYQEIVLQAWSYLGSLKDSPASKITSPFNKKTGCFVKQSCIFYFTKQPIFCRMDNYSNLPSLSDYFPIQQKEGSLLAVNLN